MNEKRSTMQEIAESMPQELRSALAAETARERALRRLFCVPPPPRFEIGAEVPEPNIP